MQPNVVERDQLAEGAVALEEGFEPRQHVDRDLAAAHHLAAEVDQAGVVTDVSMGQEDAGDSRGAAVVFAAQQLELVFEIGSGFEEPGPVAGAVEQGQAGGEMAGFTAIPVGPAAGLFTTRLRISGVLGHAEHHQLERWRQSKCRDRGGQRRHGQKQQEGLHDAVLGKRSGLSLTFSWERLFWAS